MRLFTGLSQDKAILNQISILKFRCLLERHDLT
jgi:hypothetical protein